MYTSGIQYELEFSFFWTNGCKGLSFKKVLSFLAPSIWGLELKKANFEYVI